MSLEAAITALRDDPDFAQKMVPAMLRDLHAGQERLEARLEDLTGATPDELRLLGIKFGIEGARDMAPLPLKVLLEAKAVEYRELKAQINRIDPRLPALHDLKAAAQDAIARLDFAEVETLLARVDAAETEINAETKEARARNALLTGRAEDAYRHLTAAADSFAGIDPGESLDRRNDYAILLHDHGLRYGGAGLTWATRMWQANLAAARPGSLGWAGTQTNLGNAPRCGS